MSELKKDLGLFQVTIAGVGIIIGAGIYALIGVGAGLAGNAIWLAFLISAIIAIFTGLSYAELSSIFKGDSGEYVYLKAAINRRFAFWIALAMIAGTIISSAAVALGFAGYFTKFFPMPFALAAMLLIAVMTLINIWGIKETAWYNDISTIAEILGLIIIIAIGFLKFDNKVNYLEMPNGLGGVFGAAALVFFAYLGFESIIKLRDETKNPEKTIPLGIVYSIIISSILYVLVALSAVSAVGWEQLSSTSAPMALIASSFFGNNAFIVLAILAMFATSNTVLLTMVAASRQLYGMAREHSLPSYFAKVNPRTGTPVFAIIFTAIIALFFAIIGDISIVANITNLFLFIAFAAVNLSLILLRYKYPNIKRGFKCPGNIGKFSVVAFLGLVTSLAMLIFVIINIL
ncbi:MAG: amino acid permease [Nanoarchaeota archaeon]